MVAGPERKKIDTQERRLKRETNGFAARGKKTSRCEHAF